MAIAEALQFDSLQASFIEQQYRLVEDVPALAAARHQARHQAHSIVESRREALRDGDFDAVPIPVDALGTARYAAEAQRKHGPQSLEFMERYQGLVLDCHRLLGEAARKKTFEYFPPTRHEFNPEDGQYYSHGMSIMAMTEAGLTPVAEAEELDRRVNEHVEEATYQAIGKLSLGGLVKVRTVSECTDWAIEAYERQSKGGHGGYVPEIRKLMIRDVAFDPLTGDRFEEQIGLPGLHITHEVITEALARKGVVAEGLTKTELHGAQLISDDDLLDFVSLLDAVASERSGQELFMGETQLGSRQKDYRRVREDAEHRQAALEKKSHELAAVVFELEKGGTDRWAAVGIVEAKVKEILFDIAHKDVSVAAVMFDERTMRGLQDVAYLRAIGQYDAASTLLEEVKEKAPAPGYCGAGSCGLEALSKHSADGKLAKELGLDDSQGLIKDVERKCPKCSSKKVVYDLKGKKGCLGCKATANYK